MRHVLIGTVLTMLSGNAAAATKDRHCDEVQAQLREHGAALDLKVRAVQVLDTTQGFEKTVSLALRPDVINKPCGPDAWGFILGREIVLRSSHASYAAVLGQKPWFVTHDADGAVGYFGDDTMVSAHRTVLAALFAELGFDTFEGQSGDSYQPLFDLTNREIPSRQLSWQLFGVGSIQGTLYQLTLKEIDIRFGD